MKPLTYHKGDLFEKLDLMVADGKILLVPHVVNSLGKMGAGFVVPLCGRYPVVKEKYLEWHHEKLDWQLGNIQRIYVHDRVQIVNMLAQEGLGTVRPLRYNALVNCMDTVGFEARLEECINPGQVAILAPMFGAGLAGGSWSFIEELIKDCWLPFVPVTICKL